MCMRKEYNFLTLRIPGPNSLGKCLDVYVRPLIDKLKSLWENRILTFDRNKGDRFSMRAAIMWIVRDFPAYKMLSRQESCPICMDDVNSSHHRSIICYFGCRRLLDQNQQGHRDAKAFDRMKENMPKPIGRSGDWIVEKLQETWFGVLSSCKRLKNLNPPIPYEYKC